MRSFYGQDRVCYSRQLLFLQTLLFALALIVSILWTLDHISAVPGSPWTISISFGLLVAVLAGWIVTLLQAVPSSGFSPTRRTKQMVGLVTAGVITTSILALVLPQDGSFIWKLLVFGPLLATTLVACGVSTAFVARSTKSMRHMKRRYQADQDKLAELQEVYGSKAVARIGLSHALEFGDVPGNPLPGPSGYVIAGLTSMPWHDTSEFAWTRHLEQSWQDIRAEVEAVMKDSALLSSYTYLNQEGWDALRFVDRYRVNEENCRRCPKTAAVLKTIPHYPMFRDAMFSVLSPGTHLPPHRDGSNVYLTCHLGLSIPSGSGIRAAGQTHTWEEGKCIIFDSSYEHEAWNNGDQPRVVLLIDFLHPELTDIEAEWVAARETAVFAQGA